MEHCGHCVFPQERDSGIEVRLQQPLAGPGSSLIHPANGRAPVKVTGLTLGYQGRRKHPRKSHWSLDTGCGGSVPTETSQEFAASRIRWCSGEHGWLLCLLEGGLQLPVSCMLNCRELSAPQACPIGGSELPRLLLLPCRRFCCTSALGLPSLHPTLSQAGAGAFLFPDWGPQVAFPSLLPPASEGDTHISWECLFPEHLGDSRGSIPAWPHHPRPSG